MNKNSLFALMSCILLCSACIVNKKIVLVEDMQTDTTYAAIDLPPIKVQKRDRLSIVVGAHSPELAAPFNQGGNTIAWDSGTIRSGGRSSNEQEKGYLVDEQGQIEFPILGSLKVEGLTLREVSGLIKDHLVRGQYINDPTVKVELRNLKVNMLGEVADVGVLVIPDAQITLMEAISMAGGLTVNAAPDRITVIREENGIRQVYVNNIQSRDIFESPVYYLQQNDIVYVEPRYAEVTPRTQNNWRYITTGFGLVSLVFAILNFTK